MGFQWKYLFSAPVLETVRVKFILHFPFIYWIYVIIRYFLKKYIH